MINYEPRKKMKPHSSYLYGKLCGSFSRIHAFVEQRRNMINFLLAGFDRLARLSHDVSDLPYKNRPWRIITKRLLQAQCATLIPINVGLYSEYACNNVRWQWITVADDIVNFSILMQSKSLPRTLHINPTRELSPVNLSWWHRNASRFRHKPLFVEQPHVYRVSIFIRADQFQ